MQVEEIDLALSGGRTLHIYDTVPEGGAGHLVIVWHHGTPNMGAPPEPLFAAAERTGIRWVSYDRPGYGGSTPDLQVVKERLGHASIVTTERYLHKLSAIASDGRCLPGFAAMPTV